VKTSTLASCDSRVDFASAYAKLSLKLRAAAWAPFSVSAPSRAGELGLFGVHRNQLKARSNNEEIKFATCAFAAPSLEHDPGFARYREKRPFQGEDEIEEASAFRFGGEGRDEGRSVNDHTMTENRDHCANPCSS
jgi:hypothetical protein